MIFLRTTTSILSGSVALLRSRRLISLKSLRAEINLFPRICSVRCVKLGRGWYLSSNAEFESKIKVKYFDLSVEPDMTMNIL